LLIAKILAGSTIRRCVPRDGTTKINPDNNEDKSMKLPKQSQPISRTVIGLIKNSDQPVATIGIVHASSSSKRELLSNLIHGANYNSPMRFLESSINSDNCYILSGNSMAMCLAVCGLL
jgi:hypothetical protein